MNVWSISAVLWVLKSALAAPLLLSGPKRKLQTGIAVNIHIQVTYSGGLAQGEPCIGRNRKESKKNYKHIDIQRYDPFSSMSFP